jgi:hypothetical protein
MSEEAKAAEPSNRALETRSGSDRVSAANGSSSSAMSFSKLPDEIHSAILELLDHKSVMNLTSTNAYFRRMRTSFVIYQSLLNVEPSPERLYVAPLKGHEWPCYKCLRLLEWKRFHYRTVIAMVRGENLEGTRICHHCDKLAKLKARLRGRQNTKLAAKLGSGCYPTDVDWKDPAQFYDDSSVDSRLSCLHVSE